MAESHEITNLRVAGEIDLQFKLAIASRKDWPILNQILQKGLSLISEGEREAIFKKWIHIEGTGQISRKVWLGLIITAAAILLMIIATLFWNRTLRRQVGQRTKELEGELDERRLAEEALRESEERYRSLFEESKDEIVITDQRGEFIAVNAYSLDLFGYTKREMTTMNFKDLYVNSEDGNRFQKEINEKGSVKGFEVKLRREDGGEMDCVFDVVFRRDDIGNISGYQGIIRDITEAKLLDEALRESEEKYRSMMESMNDLAYICSPDFHVEYMNPAMVKRTGRDATGELCYKAINELDEKCPWCAHDKVQQGEKCETEMTSSMDNHIYSGSSKANSDTTY